METFKQTKVTRKVSLDDDQMFLVRPPRSLRKWRISYIEVADGHFVLFGDPRGRVDGACRQIPGAFRYTGEVLMPEAVAAEVRRCLLAFEGEEASFTLERETVAQSSH